MEYSGVLPTTQFGYQKGLGPVMHFYTCPYTAKCIHTRSQLPANSPMHFAVYGRVGRKLGSCRLISAQPFVVNHHVACKLGSLGILGSLLSMLTQIMSNR